MKDFETAIENYYEFHKSKPGGLKFTPVPKLDMYYQGLYEILKSPHLHTIIMILLYKHLNEHSLVSDRTLSFSLFLLNWIIRATDKKCNKSLDDESDKNWSFYNTFNIFENAMVEKEKFAVMKPDENNSEMASNEDSSDDREWIDINESIITLLFKLYMKVKQLIFTP